MSARPEASTAAVDRLPIPESLLAPLLDTAAALLTSEDPDELPSVLRPLAGFDRRGLNRGPARQQLRRALEVDTPFRERVAERFLDREEVAVALASWSADGVLHRVEEASDRADLPLLASALYAAQPENWAFALGAVCAAYDRERSQKERDDDVKAHEIRVETLDEARRRAEEARDAAQRELTKLEDVLREERRSRRERELRADRDVEAAQRRVREAEAAVDAAEAAAASSQARLAREAERARDAEQQLRGLRRERAAREELEHQQAPGALDRAGVEALAAATEEARRLAATLERLTRQARDAAPTGAPGPRTTRVASPRIRAACPPGMSSDSGDALDAMLRTRGVVLVVDGYNVSMAGWGGATPADQRERLVAALARLHLRLRCDVVVVFDGSDVVGVTPPRRPGVRVAFSEAGEEADPVVVREVGRLPMRTPAVVASSDRWVREHAEEQGATVVSAAALLDVLRR